MKHKKFLSEKEIIHLAKLSCLKLTGQEIKKYQKQLEETVEYIDNLNELKTDGIEPTYQTTGLTNVFFDDGEKNLAGLTQEEALLNSKNKKNGYFVVKRII